MLQRLFEARSSVYLVLGVVAIVLAVVWLRTRKRRYAQGLGAVAGLLVLFFLINLVRKETDGEQIERKVKEMAVTVHTKDMGPAFAHVSDQFRRGGIDKPALRAFAQRKVDTGQLTDFQVSKFERVRFHGENPRIGTVTFRVKAITDDHVIPFRVEADFTRDPDGEWRLRDFRVYPLNSKDPGSVPGLD